MQKVTKWEDVSFILAGSYRRRVLERLGSPKTPSTISKELDINKAHVSRTLAELVEKKWVDSLTPNATKGKLFVINQQGKEVLKKALEL